MAAINETFKMLPPEARREVTDFIEFLVQKYLKKKDKTNNSGKRILRFAGAWKDMDDKDFQDFIGDVYKRREKSFKKRREM